MSKKLQLAMSEIKEILQRHDIAGYVVLYESHLSAYLLEITPSWGVTFVQDGGIRFRSKLEDFAGDRNAQRKATELSVGMLRHFADLTMRDASVFETILRELNRRLDIEHSDAVHTPHRKH